MYTLSVILEVDVRLLVYFITDVIFMRPETSTVKVVR